MSIEVNNITKVYGNQRALDDITLKIEPGNISGLLGPNGAGKSTLMKIICCYIPPTSGSALVNGFDIFEQSLEIRKRVGYLPENNPLYTDMYVKEYLDFISGIHHLKNRKERIADMISLTGLSLEQNKKIGELSKGYRQRVGLAQTLIHDPEVLILDEPTSGLDPNQIIEIRELIKNISKEKTTILSTHIMQEVEAICDRSIIINNGKIVADGNTKDLSRSFKSKNLITVEFDKKTDINKLFEIQGITNVEETGKNIYLIESVGETDIRSDIFNYAVKNNLAVLSQSKKEESLESVFQQLTKK